MHVKSKQAFHEVQSQLHLAADALCRANDAVTEANWGNLTLGYLLGQLCRVNHAVIKAIELSNEELNGSTEGEPAATSSMATVADMAKAKPAK